MTRFIMHKPIMQIMHYELWKDAKDVGEDLFYRQVALQVSWARYSLTSVFGMGTGGPYT